MLLTVKPTDFHLVKNVGWLNNLEDVLLPTSIFLLYELYTYLVIVQCGSLLMFCHLDVLTTIMTTCKPLLRCNTAVSRDACACLLLKYLRTNSMLFHSSLI